MTENCSLCGKNIDDDHYILNHAVGFYGHETEVTVVQEGVFCSRSCLLTWAKRAEEAEA